MPKTAINGMQAFDSGVDRGFPKVEPRRCVQQLRATGIPQEQQTVHADEKGDPRQSEENTVVRPGSTPLQRWIVCFGIVRTDEGVDL